ncbi:MAG: threonine ammonia-lyase IlvA, partial [Pseudomonadota bacterium]
QGFAYACRHFGVAGTVFMPVTTPQQKIQKTRVFGGENIEIKLEGDIFDQCYAAAMDHAEKTGARFVPPFDHADIIEGQATVALELLEQAGRPVDLLIIPVGGGGLAAGVTQVMRALSPKTRILYVEPAGAPSFKSSLQSQKRVRLERVDNFVDGAAVAQIGELNFGLLKSTDPNSVLLIKEDSLCETIIEMLNIEGIVLEPAGALEIDALRHLDPADLKGKTVVCLTSGGNFDFERLPEVKERALRASGRKKYYILRLPQRPGALREFLDLLGPNDDIARFEYLKKSARNFGSILLGVETPDPANFVLLNEKMDQAGFQFQDITEDDLVASFIV